MSPRSSKSAGVKRQQEQADTATPPGGMSQEALVAELLDSGVWDEIEVDILTWPEMIAAVTALRAPAEIESEEMEDAPPSLFTPDPHTADYAFNGHAGTGPSASERWMNCTASLGAARKFLETLSPNQQAEFANASGAARQGTTAHAAAEVEAGVVLGMISEEEATATILELTVMPDEGEQYSDEMGDFIMEYVDLVKQYHDEGREVLIEQRVQAVVPLTSLHEGEVYVVPGSGDMIVLPNQDADELVVGDLKYGHVDVGVEENPQVRIYAIGALTLLADEEGHIANPPGTITYYIAQPRSGGIKTWSEPLADLLKWRDEVLAPALTKALYPNGEGATFVPAEKNCEWCPARGTCGALAAQRLEQAHDLFDTVVEAEFADGPGSFPETTTLSDARLGELLAQITGLTDIAADLKAEAQRRLHRGGSVPGYKLVSYTPPRKWDESALTELDPAHRIGDANLNAAQAETLWSKKLLTPTQAIKVLEAGGLDADVLLDGLVVKPEKRPIIAPETSTKKTWEGKPPEAMFADESGAEETA